MRKPRFLRIIGLILSMVMIFPISLLTMCLYSCQSRNENGEGTSENDTTDMSGNEEVTSSQSDESEYRLDPNPTAEYENPALISWLGAPTVKYQESNFTVGDKHDYTVYMPRNDYEGFQLFLTSDEDIGDLSISTLVVEHPSGTKLSAKMYKERYTNTVSTKYEKQRWPDVIESISRNTTFSVEKGKVSAFYFKFKALYEAPAGLYEGYLTINQNGKEIRKLRIAINLWDFSLPNSSSCVTAAGLNGWGFLDYTVDYEAYYDLLLDNRLSPYRIPYDILDSRADAYMSDPRVTSFMIPFPTEEGSDSTIRAYYEKLSKNPTWLSKAYFYPIDEPSNEGALQRLKNYCERLERLFPGYRIVVPFYLDIDLDQETDEIKFMSDYVNIWCPKSALLTEYGDRTPNAEFVYNARQNKIYKPVAERMLDEVAGGDSLWWYVCNYPNTGAYTNLHIDLPGTSHRLLFWQQYDYKVQGFLYWCTNAWSFLNESRDPYDGLTTEGTNDGEGVLIYPGENGQPVPTLRLECVRDGIEDFELLTMAEKLVGREKVDEIVDMVTTDLLHFTDDDDLLMSVRAELGKLICDNMDTSNIK